MSADAGIIPYQATCLNNYFCTPNKLFEFIAAGLPIVASDLPEINRLVLGHQLGLVGKMDTGASMARLIDEMFQSENQLLAWKTHAESAAQSLNWDIEGKKLVELFSQYGKAA